MRIKLTNLILRVIEMPADLNEKVKKYEDMLKRALQKAKYSPIPEFSHACSCKGLLHNG